MKKAMKLFAVLFTALFVLLGCAKEESTAFELKNGPHTSILTATLESKDGVITQLVTIDYSVAKLKDLQKAFPDSFSGDGNAVSFKASRELIEKAGYTEKK